MRNKNDEYEGMRYEGKKSIYKGRGLYCSLLSGLYYNQINLIIIIIVRRTMIGHVLENK